MIVRKLFWLFGVMALAVAVFLPGYMKILGLRDKNADLQEKNKRLEAENVLLQRELERIENDKLYQEKILREKLGVVRKDEIPVKMIPTD